MTLMSDLAYRSEPFENEYQRDRCLLDLSLPEGETGFPMVVWFHGGGLEAGCKEGDVTVALAKYGIGVAVISYRLYPAAKFPAPVDDAAAAVAWTLRNAEKYGGDPNSVFVAGHSAGGYLAALVASDASYLAKYGVRLDCVAGVIPISGQMFTHATVRGERGVPDPWNKPTIDDAAPCYYAGKHIPPILDICGGDDLPARPEENRYFIALLKSQGHVSATYLEVPGRTHDTILSTIAEPGDTVGVAMLDFIAKHRR